MTDSRIETDSIGNIEVDNTRYWGAQTQRSIENFPFDSAALIRFPNEFLR
ncbi:MAG: class II fumarate hydratase, partial [Candidatus Hodarchaeota archaeon]